MDIRFKNYVFYLALAIQTLSIPITAAGANELAMSCNLLANVQNPEVFRLFVRRAKAQLEDAHYLANISASLTDDFVPWFEGRSEKSYLEMLSAQHKTAILGRDRNTPYTSPQRQNWGLEANQDTAGFFRIESDMQAAFDPESVCSTYWCPKGFFQHLKALKKNNTMTLELSGIPEKYLPKIEIQYRGILLFKRPGKLTFPYAQPAALPSYLERMQSLMESLRSFQKGSSLDDFIEPLADYVQIFALTLPFDNVNFSLAMSQANFILTHHGFRGVEHGALDYLSMAYSSKEYRKIFKQYILLNQSNLKAR